LGEHVSGGPRVAVADGGVVSRIAEDVDAPERSVRDVATVHTGTDRDGDEYQFARCECGGEAHSLEDLEDPVFHRSGCEVVR
ncbi:hypothetical protein ACFQE1_04395, partial [Halobium palmae]